MERLKALSTLEPLALFAEAEPLASVPATRDVVTRVKRAGRKLEQMAPHCWTDATCEFVVEPG